MHRRRSKGWQSAEQNSTAGAAKAISYDVICLGATGPSAHSDKGRQFLGAKIFRLPSLLCQLQILEEEELVVKFQWVQLSEEEKTRGDGESKSFAQLVD